MITTTQAAQKIVISHPDRSLSDTMEAFFSDAQFSTTREDQESLEARAAHNLPQLSESPLVIVGDPYVDQLLAKGNRFLDAPEEGTNKLVQRVKEEFGSFAGIMVNSALLPFSWFSNGSFPKTKDIRGVPIVASGPQTPELLTNELERMLNIRRGFVRTFAHDASRAATALGLYLYLHNKPGRSPLLDADAIRIKKNELASETSGYEKSLRNFDPTLSGSSFLLVHNLPISVIPITAEVSPELCSKGIEISAEYVETQVGASLIVKAGIARFRRAVDAISALYDGSLPATGGADQVEALKHAEETLTAFDDFLKVVYNLWTTRKDHE
jgi:hypothetical protein